VQGLNEGKRQHQNYSCQNEIPEMNSKINSYEIQKKWNTKRTKNRTYVGQNFKTLYMSTECKERDNPNCLSL